MLNLIIIDEDSRINGIKTYISEIVQIFKRLNARIYLINHSNTSKDLFSAEDADGIVTYSFSYRLCESYNKILDKFLGFYLKDSERNLFMLNYIPCEDLVLILKKRFPKSKITFTIHDMSWTYHFLGDTDKFKDFCLEAGTNHVTDVHKNIRNNYLEEQRMFKLVDKVIVLAEETIHVLTDIYRIDREKLCLIPNGAVDLYEPIQRQERLLIRRKKYLEEKEKIVLFAGRGHYIKGLYAMLRCFGRILEIYPKCRLVIVGSIIDQEKTLRLANMNSARIIFTGQLPRTELLEWYRISDIGLLISYVEQCSYTGIEMMMHGIPVIASDGFCVGDMFKDGLNAKVAKIGKRDNSEEFENNLVGAVLELLSSAQQCKNLGENARKQYLLNHQFSQMEIGYRKLAESLFGRLE